MKPTYQTRIDLHSALCRAILAATPELSRALEWLETTDPCLDLDDARLAEATCIAVLADFAQGEGEMPMSVYQEALDQGALMTEEDWLSQDEKAEDMLFRAMEFLRGDA